MLIPLLDSKAVRDVEKNLADSQLHQWFCHIGNFGVISSPSKSTIDRYKNWYDQDQLRQAFQIQKLLERDARGGTRLPEIIMSHFGVQDPMYLVLQRPEFLAGSTARIAISPIV